LALPTEKDYRAWLAFLWTILTFAVVFYLAYKGYAVQDIAAITKEMFVLDGIFIYAYFKGKEK